LYGAFAGLNIQQGKETEEEIGGGGKQYDHATDVLNNGGTCCVNRTCYSFRDPATCGM
jgi:hypothetical protein